MEDKKTASECENMSELISAYFDGELSDADALRVGNHLESCPECRELFGAFLALSENIKDSAEIPSELHGSVMSAVRRAKTESGGKIIRNSRLRRIGLIGGAAACAVICMAVLAKPFLFGNAKLKSSDADISVKNQTYGIAPAEIKNDEFCCEEIAENEKCSNEMYSNDMNSNEMPSNEMDAYDTFASMNNDSKERADEYDTEDALKWYPDDSGEDVFGEDGELFDNSIQNYESNKIEETYECTAYTYSLDETHEVPSPSVPRLPKAEEGIYLRRTLHRGFLT